MNKAFQEVAAQTRNHIGELTHQQRVTRLYRQSLRLTFSWAVDRKVFLNEAAKLRTRFDSVKGSPSSSNVKYAVEEGEKTLIKYAHPDSYVIPWMPGGSKFMRNPPPPPEVAHYGSHPPPDASSGTNTPVWPDMVPITQRPKEKVTSYLVDFAKKTME